MPNENFYRMIRLATEFFDTKNDPSQLDIDELVIARLIALHPASMGEITDANGPVAWTIVIPSTKQSMDYFLSGTISETELLKQSEQEKRFDTVYLCSALVLPEHRGKGYARKLVCDSIRVIQKDHAITSLFYWGFSSEGESLARSVAKELRLPIFHRTPHKTGI